MQEHRLKIYAEHYFVLDSRKKILLFYKSSAVVDQKPQGFIPLDSFFIREDQDNKYLFFSSLLSRIDGLFKDFRFIPQMKRFCLAHQHKAK